MTEKPRETQAELHVVELKEKVNNSSQMKHRSRPRHVVVDATGLRVYGSGEWHVRKHRHGRRRAWRKLHLDVDERTKEMVAVEVTLTCPHERVHPLS